MPAIEMEKIHHTPSCNIGGYIMVFQVHKKKMAHNIKCIAATAVILTTHKPCPLSFVVATGSISGKHPIQLVYPEASFIFLERSGLGGFAPAPQSKEKKATDQ
ncbi:MAG TPA: hypothetical protein VK645_07490 [Chitinophagaceae bacterium]|nr:hypothetical protein [Chitinophagaceae bacterium]